MKSLGNFHIEDAQQLVNELIQNGIEAQSQTPLKKDDFPVVPNISAHAGDYKGEAGYLEVLVPEDKFSQAESIRKEVEILTLEENLGQLPVSEKNLNTIMEIEKAGRLLSALASGGVAKGRGETEMGLPEWHQLIGIVFGKDTLAFFKKTTSRKLWLTLLLTSGAVILISWVYLGIYKSTNLPFGYLLLGWLELCILTLAAVLKERFNSILGTAFGVMGSIGILLVILVLIFAS